MYKKTSDRVLNIIIAFAVLATFAWLVCGAVMYNIAIIILVFIFLFPAIAAVWEIFDELANAYENYERRRRIRKHKRERRDITRGESLPTIYINIPMPEVKPTKGVKK